MPEETDLNNKVDPPAHGMSASVHASTQNAHPRTMDEYRKLYEMSIENPSLFWGSVSREFSWKTEPSGTLLAYNFDVRNGPIDIKWMEGAETNICYNALDRNIERGLAKKIAFYWEGNDVGNSCSITYGQLHHQVCKFANVLKSKGVARGDTVTIYMPMALELVTSMLACSRIGAVHNVVFGGFSSDSLAERILDSKSSLLIIADGTWRGTKLIKLKEIADEAAVKCLEKKWNIHCIVVRHLSQNSDRHPINGNQRTKSAAVNFQVSWNAERDSWWHEELADVPQSCEPEWLPAEHPSFVLYTSGSTGKPKGVLHTTAGYMLYAATTFKYSFAYERDDVYFCTADFGWITGHSYGLYGPLLNGATSVMFEGIPTYPDPGRYWSICERYKVSIFYTAPTAIRTLMKYGDTYVQKHNLESLRVLGTVGEPINPEAWHWYFQTVGSKRCSVVDTYWQSETGGHMITPLANCTPLKAGSAALPFFGVIPAILNENGTEIEGTGEGYLVFKKPWPGMMRSLYNNHERFSAVYFRRFPGYYFTGDGARRDSDGYYWITGRTDDMLNVSGHLLSTSEVESALVEHESCSESAVVSYPHAVKGECLYCYVVLKQGISPSEELNSELKDKVRSKIGTFATPDFIHYTPVLPKTRSGKIMRRILRKISRNESDLGDLSTLSEQSAIDVIYSTQPRPSTSRSIVSPIPG